MVEENAVQRFFERRTGVCSIVR